MSVGWDRRREAGAVRPAGRTGVLRAFTVIEILVVLSIIATLLALLMPALQACRQSGRNLRCMTQMKNIAVDFRMFADDFAFKSRGDGRNLPEPGQEGFSFEPRQFWIEDFQESQYGISEFWSEPQVRITALDASRQSLMCPEGSSDLRRRPKLPCSSGAIFPKENVSMGFNRRLFRPGPDMAVRALSSKILDFPDVPLALDVDGQKARRQNRDPYYLAPPRSQPDGYEGGQFWFPAFRHRARLNVAFVGGHVVGTRDPLGAPGFRWEYQPD